MRKGFTLLEVLFAVSLSALILLLSVAAVRSAAQSLRILQRSSGQTELLVTGLLAGLGEADRWRSHADPAYPYLKSWMGEQFDLPDRGNDHPWDKRPFRSIVDMEQLDPAALLPHDPRSWYRGALGVGTPYTARLPNAEWKLAVASMESGDPTTVPGYSKPSGVADQLGDVMWIGAAFSNAETTVGWIPTGWWPWQMQGDYAAISNVVTDPTVNGGIEAGRCELQARIWNLFGELGHYGVLAYSPPGTINLISRPVGNRLVDNIGVADRWYDWGELPWSLAVGAVGGGDFSPDLFASPAMAGARRSNYFLGMAGSPVLRGVAVPTMTDAGRLSYVYTFFTPTNTRGSSNKFTAIDLTQATGDAPLPRLSAVTAPYALAPLAAFLPGRVFALDDGSWDVDSLVDSVVIDPIRRVFDDRAQSRDAKLALRMQHATGNLMQLSTDDRMRSRHVITTWLQPTAPTDAEPAVEELLRIERALRLEVFRYHRLGSERLQSRIAVVESDDGRGLEMAVSLLGSNLRGARRAWALAAGRSQLLGDR